MERDWAIACLAELQHGVVSRAQLVQAGLGQGAITHRMSNWRLHPVHRGIYRVGHTAPLPLAREMAAVLACGERALLSHSSAAFLWGLAPEPDGDVEVTITGGGRRRRPGIRIHRSAVQPADATGCRGIPVTSPARTLLDFAGAVGAIALERAVEEAQRRRLVDRRGLLLALERAPRGRGRAAMRALLERQGGPALTRSEAEARLLSMLRAAELPPAEMNVRVGSHEVDMLWRAEGLVVEVDGFEHHRSRQAFERDRMRDGRLQASGVRVLRVTWRQLVDQPEAVIARVAQALTVGAARP